MDRINSNNQVSHKVKSPFRAYNGDEDYIFVSYKHKDADIVYPVIKQFHDLGFNIWYDEGLPYGENFDIVIPNKIEGAALFINFLTHECMACANNSEDYMVKESGIAQYLEVPILAIFLEPDVKLKGYYLTNFLNKQSIYRKEYGDNEDLFIETCIDAFMAKGIKPKPKNEKKVKRISKIVDGPFPAYEGDENYIFVSYTHKDAESVFPDIERFHDKGYPIWYDEHLTEGPEYDEKIEKSLLNSSLFVVFISENSMASDNVIDQINLALEENIDIVLIYLEKAKLAKGLRLRLNRKHAISKHKLNDNVYLRDCFKAFNKYKIPKITEKSVPDDRLTSEYLKDFDELNITTRSIFELENYNTLIILKDGTNLTDWNDVKNKKDIIYVSEDLSDYTDLSEKYAGLESLKAIVTPATNKITNMESMFSGCFKLADISALSDWNIAEVSNTSEMFKDCSNLKDLSPLSKWDTAQVTNMPYMFYNCTGLKDISPLSNWDTSQVTNMSKMFSGCTSLEDISALSNWNTTQLTHVSWIFAGCFTLKDITPLKNWDTTKLMHMSKMFRDCSSLDDISSLSNWDTKQVTSMSEMFKDCSSLEDLSPLSDWNTSQVTNMSEMFNGCSKLKDITPLKNWDTKQVTDVKGMFNGCSSLEDLSALSYWDTTQVTDISKMLAYCSSLKDITPLKNWDTTQVTSMSEMLSYCSSLKDMTPLKNWDTTQVTNMHHMFSGCSKLEDITPLENWDTSQVTNMDWMFAYCSSLEDITPLKNWDTTQVTNMNGMFNGCSSLEDLSPLSDWDTTQVTDMDWMFSGCKSNDHPSWYE